MMRTVNAVAAARKTARYVCSPRFLNASSGPYAEDERPSAPRPTQARKAMSEMCRKRCGSCRSFGPPRRNRFSRCPALGRCSGSGGTDCAGVLIAKSPRTHAPRSLSSGISRPRANRRAWDCIMQPGGLVFLAFRKRVRRRRERGSAATDSLAGLPPDLAFVDLRLGREGGLAFLGSLLAERPALGVTIITASAPIDPAVDATRRGARDYLPKPFTPAQIQR